MSTIAYVVAGGGLHYSFSLNKPPKPRREKIEALQKALESIPQVECPVRHFFSPGLYTREMTIPAGITAVGATHKTRHLTTVKGHCLIESDEGMKEVNGFAAFISMPGIKRAAHAITETVVTTFHETEETDMDKLAELLTDAKACELLGGSENRQLLANKAKEVTA
jgi:hypothetical protein